MVMVVVVVVVEGGRRGDVATLAVLVLFLKSSMSDFFSEGGKTVENNAKDN